MATFVLDNAHLTFNSVDLSDHVVSCQLTINTDEQEDTAMGVNWKSFLAGLNSWSVTAEFRDDFAASNVADTIWTAQSARTTATILVKPEDTTVSSTNPSFSGSAFISSAPAMGGSVGTTANKSVTFRGSGTLTRATS